MPRDRELRIAAAAAFVSDKSAPLVKYTGRRVNQTVGSSSSAATALPAGAKIVELRLTDAIYLRFGDTSVGVAAADVNSDLVVGGEKLVVVPDGATHFRAIRVGSADVALQIAEVETE
jgi:hypothetical protein